LDNRRLKKIYDNPYLLLLVCTACWGGNAVAARFAVDEVSPLLLTSLRWAGVTLIIWLMAYSKIIRYKKILMKRWLYLFCMGAIGFTGFNILFYISAHSTTAINIGILQGALPVFVLLGAFLIFRETILPIQLGGITITILGVVIVATEGDFNQSQISQFNKGDLLILGACLIYAIYTIFLRNKPNVPGMVMFAVIAVSAMLASLPFAFFEFLSANTVWPTHQGWLVVLFVVIFPSFLSQLFFIRGVHLIGRIPSRSVYKSCPYFRFRF
jgi:drug/metabolite transporter (DMT)-like permease